MACLVTAFTAGLSVDECVSSAPTQGHHRAQTLGLAANPQTLNYPTPSTSPPAPAPCALTAPLPFSSSDCTHARSLPPQSHPTLDTLLPAPHSPNPLCTLQYALCLSVCLTLRCWPEGTKPLLKPRRPAAADSASPSRAASGTLWARRGGGITGRLLVAAGRVRMGLRRGGGSKW